LIGRESQDVLQKIKSRLPAGGLQLDPRVTLAGMAVIAALIGAGGFGALVFQGLLSSALDLVLLGVIPVIALAVIVDALFGLWIALLKVKEA